MFAPAVLMAPPDPTPVLTAPAPEPARSPGPPSFATLRGSGYAVFGEVFGRYSHETWNGQAYRAFDLPRARLGADAVLSPWISARMMLETVRSAAPGSLYGVEGDSIVVRAREVYGEASAPPDWPVSLRVRGGLVPTLAITPLEVMWGRRVIAPTSLEAAGYASPADLGAALLVGLPEGLGEIALGVFNGEGFTQHEQNEGKTSQVRLWLTPIERWLPEKSSLKLLVHYEDGSVGPTQARADRLVLGSSFELPVASVGLDVSFVDGVAGRSDQRARTAAAWLRLGPFLGVEGVARYEQIDPDRRSNAGQDRTTVWQAGLGYRASLDNPRQAFELYLTYRSATVGDLARGSEPRLPQKGPRLDLRVAF